MKPKITPSTQSHLDIKDIASDLVLLKSGFSVMILEVSALNFGLLSEKEQDATIYAYAQLLNSLTFSIQIIISSRQKDVSEYIKKIDERLEKSQSPLLKGQLIKYREFIKSVVRQGNVLDKKFYVAMVDQNITNLAPKRDHLTRLLSRIGLRTKQLNTQELLQLFYDFYNRNTVGTKVNL